MITDFNQLKEAKFSIYLTDKGKELELELDAANVADFAISWDYSDILVQGYILFEDVFQYTEIIPVGNGFNLKISLKDFFGNEFNKTFVVTKVTKQMQGQSSKLIAKLDFVNIYYNMLANTFLSKGFENKKSTEILEDILKTGEKLLPDSSKIEVVKSDEEPIKQYVVKGSQSLLKELRQIQAEYNLLTVSNRSSITILPTNKISSCSPDFTGISVFSPNPTYEYSPFFVKTFDILGNNSFNHNIILPKCKTFNVTNKKITKKEHSDETAHSNLGLSSTLTMKDGTEGLKIYPYKHSIFEGIYNTRLLESSSLGIEVNGMFSHNLLQKVKFDSNSTIEKLKGKMPFVNGTYYITKIIDRIIGGSIFGQYITISRAGVE